MLFAAQFLYFVIIPLKIQMDFVCLFDWVLRHIDTVYVIWRHSSFTGRGSPKVPLSALFQARTGT
jgi:hypothetical protein